MSADRGLTIQVTPVQYLDHLKKSRGLTQDRIYEILKAPPYRVKVSTGYLSEIFGGKTPLSQVGRNRPDVLAGLLILLGVQDLEAVGLTPEHAPMADLILEGYRRKGLPPVPPSDETKITHTYPSSHQLVTSRAA